MFLYILHNNSHDIFHKNHLISHHPNLSHFFYLSHPDTPSLPFPTSIPGTLSPDENTPKYTPYTFSHTYPEIIHFSIQNTLKMA
nr:MAG TPA: hypothetical protein [Caudoviricetes sp.]